MKIEKVLNNNVVISMNDKNEDVIVMGSGVAFQKKRGDVIDESKIERIFTQQVHELADKFKEVLKEIPEEYFEITEKIIKNAENTLKQRFNDTLYISLMDHIHFTLKRYYTNMLIENRLLLEIKMLYKDEFEAGLDAVDLINDTFGIVLPEDEAAFIALHFVNASSNSAMKDTLQKTQIVKDTLTIIKNFFRINLDEESMTYFRLVTHLKFFAQRIIQNKRQKSLTNDLQLFEVVKNKYKKSYLCVERITKYIQIQFGYTVTDEEKLYLTIHIERIQEIND